MVLQTSNLPVAFTLDIEPVVASRPRVGKFGTFYEGKYRTWLKEAPKTVPNFQTPFMGALVVVVRIVCTKPRTGKLSHPMGDVDNFAKGVLDVLTHAKVWGDDKQVVRLDVSKRYAKNGEKGHVDVRISSGDE